MGVDEVQGAAHPVHLASCEFALSMWVLSIGFGYVNGEVQHLHHTRPSPLPREAVDGKGGGQIISLGVFELRLLAHSVA